MDFLHSVKLGEHVSNNQRMNPIFPSTKNLVIENDRADHLLVWLHEQKIFENKSTGCRLKDKKTDVPIECEKTRGQEDKRSLQS